MCWQVSDDDHDDDGAVVKTFIIQRALMSPSSTVGVMSCGGDLMGGTLELPWMNNMRNVSCIPVGVYNAFYRDDGANGPCYELRDVPGRGHIQIHAGNTVRDIEGCILLGALSPYPEVGVWNSRTHLGRFLELADGDEIRVIVRGDSAQGER